MATVVGRERGCRVLVVGLARESDVWRPAREHISKPGMNEPPAAQPAGGVAAQGKKQKNKRRRRNSKVTANGTASKPSAPARCLKVRVATINRLAHPRPADSEVRNERGQRGPEGCAKQAATMSIHLLRGDLLRLLALRPQGVPVHREDEDFGSRCDCAYITGGAPRVGRNQASGSA